MLSLFSQQNEDPDPKVTLFKCSFGVESCQRPLENLSLSAPFLHPVISTEKVL